MPDLHQQAYSPRPPSSDSEDYVEGGVELPPEPRGADEDEEEQEEEGADESELGGDESVGHRRSANTAAAAGLGITEEEPAPQSLPGLSPPGHWIQELWPSSSGVGDGHGERRALFLDYDGTLRELEPRPELAVPTEEVLDLLSAIDAREELVPHLISGRGAEFLEAHFGHLRRFTLMAEHGFQVRRPDGRGWQKCEPTMALEGGAAAEEEAWRTAAREAMQSLVQAMPESHVEEKASSLVWHFREVPDQEKAEEAAERAIDALEHLGEELLSPEHRRARISRGHKIVEVSCRKARKGPAMRQICESKALFGRPFLSVLVAGDDESDESMFDVAPPDFLTVKVGPGASRARFRADSPGELRAFLWQLLTTPLAAAAV